MSITSAFAFESLTLSDKPSLLSASIYSNAEKAFISVEGSGRFRYDGEDPTVSVGHMLRDGMSLVLHGELQMNKFKAVTDGFCILSVSYERV